MLTIEHNVHILKDEKLYNQESHITQMVSYISYITIVNNNKIDHNSMLVIIIS